MAFTGDDICIEIQQRRDIAGRLSLIEFDAVEYETLLEKAKHIVFSCWTSEEKLSCARLVFLAFTMDFVRRYKYIDDNVFWPDFEQVLGLKSLDRRSQIVDNLLWPAYQEEGLYCSTDGRGRRIVGTLLEEMNQAQTWVTEARNQFVDFFKWYYTYHASEKLTFSLVEKYRSEANKRFIVLDKVLPTLTHDCQMLSRTLDYALENNLYLETTQFQKYRQELVLGLGPDFDPSNLRLLRDERSLVNLLREIQNHVTPVQFRRVLNTLYQGFVVTPWNKPDPEQVSQVLQRFSTLPYGLYTVENAGQTRDYRVVPHPRLTLEILNEWDNARVISLWNGRFVAYKNSQPFKVLIGRRSLEAIPYICSAKSTQYIWVGEAPTGQKLIIDGQLCPESSGADWQIALQLENANTACPGFRIAITRLMLYYPEQPHAPIKVWGSNGYLHEDSLREDGVRRFHLHGDLVITLMCFDLPFKVSVGVSDVIVLDHEFTPESCYLFSAATRAEVKGRGLANFGDREYVLFVQDDKIPQASQSVSIESLPQMYGQYHVYRVTWADINHPFDLRVGTTHWAFLRRREFQMWTERLLLHPYLSLKPHQCLDFHDFVLHFYCTVDLEQSSMVMDVYAEEGFVGRVDLKQYLVSMDTAHFFSVAPEVWDVVTSLTANLPGKYLFRFYQNEELVGEHSLSLLPNVSLSDWRERDVYSEFAQILLQVTSSQCLLWDHDTQQLTDKTRIRLQPKTHREPWEDTPGLWRIVPDAISSLLVFPQINETLEITVCPQLYGYRLYQKHPFQDSQGQWGVKYQGIQQVDHDHLHHTALHIFSAPQNRIIMRVGALDVWSGETNHQGDILLDALDVLRRVCLDQENEVTLCCENGLCTTFTVRWTPLIKSLVVEKDEIIVDYNGPEGAAVRLRLCQLTGELIWTYDLACDGERATLRVPLPKQRQNATYLVADYVLVDGSVRPAAWQVWVEGQPVRQLPMEWLEQGVAIPELEDLFALGLLQRVNHVQNPSHPH